MANAERLSPISVEDYLAGEQRARLKHEYVAGMIYAFIEKNAGKHKNKTKGKG